MTTMQHDWDLYFRTLFPDGAPDIQRKELHRAFFAAAFVTLQKMDAISALPEPQAIAKLREVTNEVNTVMAQNVANAQDRN